VHRPKGQTLSRKIGGATQIWSAKWSKPVIEQRDDVFARRAGEAVLGPFDTSSDARYLVAFEGKADVSQQF
jgi:hypothetical protein